MGRGGQDTGDEKPRMTRKGAKSRKCRKDERETKQDMGNHRNQEGDRAEGGKEIGKRVRCMGRM